MRISAVLISVALLSVSTVATFSQSPMMMETTGIYVNVGGGLAILPGTTDTPHSKDFPPSGHNRRRQGKLGLRSRFRR